MKRLLIFLAGFIFIFASYDKVLAENFTIKEYDIQINVQKNKSFHITEKIDTNFHRKAHGILRTIPITYKLVREDGSKQNVKSAISNTLSQRGCVRLRNIEVYL